MLPICSFDSPEVISYKVVTIAAYDPTTASTACFLLAHLVSDSRFRVSTVDEESTVELELRRLVEYILGGAN